jgi:hypothetical protein
MTTTRKTETTILLYGVGPVDFNYVNPADDPRTKTSQRRTTRRLAPP